MAEKAYASIVLQIGTPEGEGGGGDAAERFIEVSLDETRNVDENGNSISRFEIGDTAYLKVVGSHLEEEYQLMTTWGRVRKVAIGVSYEMRDQLTFAKATTANLSAPASGTPEWRWIGNVEPSTARPIFEGADVRLTTPVFGVLDVEYQTLGDSWSLVVAESFKPKDGGELPIWEPETESMDEIDEPLPVLVMVVQGETNASATVNYHAEKVLGEGDWEDWTIKIVRDCSGEIIDGATVTVNGVNYLTGIDGLIELGKIAPGTVLNIHVRKDDFSKSYSMTIPEPSAEPEKCPECGQDLPEE